MKTQSNQSLFVQLLLEWQFRPIPCKANTGVIQFRVRPISLFANQEISNYCLHKPHAVQHKCQLFYRHHITMIVTRQLMDSLYRVLGQWCLINHVKWSAHLECSCATQFEVWLVYLGECVATAIRHSQIASRNDLHSNDANDCCTRQW